jgi:hypothetical protein
MPIYTLSNWYWCIGASTAQVFSSATFTFVSPVDTNYLAWLAAANSPTQIDTGVNLYAVLAQQVIPVVLAAGIPLISVTMPQLNATYPLDPISQAYMTGISTGITAGKIPGGGPTFLYNAIEFTPQLFIEVSAGLMSYIYDFNLALGTYLATNGEVGILPSLPVTIA